METENEKELWERLTAVEQSTKSAHHRLDSLYITGRRNRKTSYKAIRNSRYRHYYGNSGRFDRLFC